MMTSSRPRDVGGSFASRRGHAAQLSISDPSHHVTEAIGTLYGDDDDGYSSSDSRPVSLTAQTQPDNDNKPLGKQRPGMPKRQSDRGPYKSQAQPQPPPTESPDHQRDQLTRTTSDNSPMTLSTVNPMSTSPPSIKKSHTLPTRIPSQRQNSYEGSRSPMSPPSPSLRDVQADQHGSQFPLTHMDNPNDIAQELSNLQALRRMSMDVGNMSDPDLLPFSSVSLMPMPSEAPQGDDDEGDPSRLLWVPARVHPELDTNAFKNFLENRVQSMKRRSGESMLSVEGMQLEGSTSLRRKKSMLSRQVARGDVSEDYMDGSERLQRNGSQKIPPIPEVSLEELVKDPTKVVQKLAQDSLRQDGTSSESGLDTDIILPAAPGMGLRRSTRTTYRKGGSLRGERVPFARRIAERKAGSGPAAEPEDKDSVPPVPSLPSTAPPAPPGHSLQRVQSEPVAENFSRPSRSVRRQQNFAKEAPAVLSPPTTPEDTCVRASQDSHSLDGAGEDQASSEPKSWSQQLPYRTSSALAQRSTPIPQIVETPPAEESSPTVERPPSRPFPERSSSTQKTPPAMYPSQPEEPPARSSKRPSPGSSGRPFQAPTPAPAPIPAQSTPSSITEKAASDKTVNDMANHPSPLPGGGASRTDSLTFIPTYDDNKAKKDKDDTASISSTKSSAWKWFKGDKEDKKKKEKQKERELEKEEQTKKGKGKPEKAQGEARMDVLQSSIDTVVAKGRESLLLDRESIDNKLTEERKKESTRKTSDSKKEKEGFFGGLFGTKKKSSEKELGPKKKDQQRALSPEPPSRPLRPDIDFAWSRFTIIEERAIYRMAHIKLANPRRSLQSQVLLSNFMYSYLAKVQAMHPQIQVPVSPQQKRLEEERKRKEAEQQQQRLLEQQQQQAAQQDGNFNFEYHRSGNQQQYGSSPVRQGDYIDDSETYAYDHQGEENGSRAAAPAGNENGAYHNSDGYGSNSHSRQESQDYNSYYGQGNPYGDDDSDDDHDNTDGRSNMW